MKQEATLASVKARTALKPVQSRRTVQDQVYEQLRDALMSGAFEARETFTIAALAERFATSHMPVREALRRLAAENALRIAASGTAFVPDLERGELDDISRARCIIEGATAEIAAPLLGADDIAILRALIEVHHETGTSGDIVAMAAANRQFHFHIYAAAQSPVLMSQIENLWLRSGPYVRFLSDQMAGLLRTDYRSDFTRHHTIMLDALHKGDTPAFRRAVEDDIRATQALLHNFFDPTA